MPSLVDRHLAVRTAASGLEQPVNLAFLGHGEMLVLEKATGRVRRVVNGVVTATVLDLPVNSASERGLLGIALHPSFKKNRFVYLFWTETLSGADSNALEDVPLLGNRVDRYVWDGSTLTFDLNLIHLRAFQADEGQPLRGNHNGGVMAFGLKERGRHHRDRGRGRDSDEPRARLYIQVGDGGRRGQLQNLEDGPFGPNEPDDQFGGPEPDDAHLTGVILRLNDDGSAPEDNPVLRAWRAVGGEVGANLQKIFAYGIRNGFGMAFDPSTGNLWEQENGDDSFSELNQVSPGFNSGWVQIWVRSSASQQYKAIETDPDRSPAIRAERLLWAAADPLAAHQHRRLAGEALHACSCSRRPLQPAGDVLEIRSITGWHRASSRQAASAERYENDLIMGNARPDPRGGPSIPLQPVAQSPGDPRDRSRRLRDRVADNRNKFDIQESESLLFGRNFGTVVDLKNGPNGNLYVVSLDHGTIYEIHRRDR